MKITTHGNYLFQLTRWPLLFPVNVYLVREADGLTLIDAGVPGSTKAILAAARDIGAPIVRIALTHADDDHVGSLDALHAALPEAEVLMSPESAERLRGRRRTRPTRMLQPGDRVGSLEVIAAPGHGPDQIAFFDTRDRTLITGDAFQTRGRVAVTSTVVPSFPFPGWFTADKPTALATARTLRALEPSRLAVGHGVVIDEPLDAMDRAIAFAERKLAGRIGHVSH